MRQPEHAPKRSPRDLAALRSRLDGTTGPRYWRGLEELAETREFLDYLHREFPEQAEEWNDPASRRQFLKVMAASLALAGLTGCAFQPPERIVPYVEAPEELVPGKPLFFATSYTIGGDCVGLLVESHEGRPTKIEGNALHPAVPAAFEGGPAGASDHFAQAELLNLYDPDRSQEVLRNARPTTWQTFQDAMLDESLRRKAAGTGDGFRLLTPSITSPTLAAQIRGLLDDLPGAQWHQYEPVHRDNARAGAIRAFGKDAQPVYDFEKADRILSLDADFLSSGPGHLVHARGYADRRVRDVDAHPEGGDAAGMNRLYVVECNLTITGAKADHRLPLAAGRIKDFALAIARELGVSGLPDGPELPEAAQDWIGPVARDLREHGGASLVIAGEGQPPVVHALAHAMNDVLGNVGATVRYIEPVVAESVDQTESIRSLVADMKAGKVDMLVMLGVNPVYDAPADLGFEEAMVGKIPMLVHSNLYLDETGIHCKWHVPMAHFLESWGDGRAFDGTATLQQPLIEPLYGGQSMLHVVAALRGIRDPQGLALLEEHWKDQLSGGQEITEAALNRRWRQSIHDGLIGDTAYEAIDVSADGSELATADDFGDSAGGIDLVLAPDPTIYDGRYANNAWLQECPKPLTKLTWDNALMVPPSMVEADGELAGRESGDLVGLTIGTVTLPKVAIWVMPGHAEGAVTLHLGYGRKRAGRVADEARGFNAYTVRTSEHPWIVTGVKLDGGSGERYSLVSTQLQRSIEGRDIVRGTTLDYYREHPEFAHAGHHTTAKHGELTPSLYPPYDYEKDRSDTYGDGWNHWPGYAWGMTVDLTRCIGCTACVVACQSENNIPVVGKREVQRGRIMHWMEVDRYYALKQESEDADLSNPDVAFQPRFCMHCEKAPCEPVCPVGATVHDHEGLNNMVYNRCVGTRYCSNNCPYKVRHFNFLKYTEIRLKETALSTEISPLNLLHNPDVTVRPRGVMEKCTYCVQRIYQAKIQSELEDRRVRDGEIVTACQSACPTRALVFGDLNDEGSVVVQNKTLPRNYGMLAEELNTRPRTSYLALLTNPNPELQTA